MRNLLAFAFIPCSILLAQAPAEPLLTVAEKSDFKATSRHADVQAFCQRLAKESPLVRLAELGESAEHRKLPLLILADPPIATATEAERSRKLVVFVMANIHAGEVDGKEAVLMLARDLALPKPGREAAGLGQDILKHLILVIAPIFNADGNERISADNRRAQNGPADGVGIRANAQGFDLNRDFVKLESPEVRCFVRFLNEWDPAVVVDCHTTNGSHHRYTLTYEGGRCPAGDPAVVAFTRDTLLPDLTRRLQQKTGYRSWFYGNFSADRSKWETVSPTPRYGTHYVGLRNRIAILSESYSYASFKDRVLASKGFVESICAHTAENHERVRNLLAAARARSSAADGGHKLVLRHEAKPLGRPVTVAGWVEEIKDDRRVVTQQPKEYEVEYMGDDRPTLTVTLPTAYLIPAEHTQAIENLKRHGVRVEELPSEAELEVEVYRVDKLTRTAAFQRHQPVTLEATPRREKRRIPAKSVLVKTTQPLGALAAHLLEPQSPDGLATWNFFDDALKEGGDFPVLRLVK